MCRAEESNLYGSTQIEIGTLNSLHKFRKRHFEVMLYFKGKSNCLTFRKRDLVAVYFSLHMHLNMIYAGNEGFKIEIYLKEIPGIKLLQAQALCFQCLQKFAKGTLRLGCMLGRIYTYLL